MIILIFVLGFIANRVEKHIKPTIVDNPLLFNIGKIISYTSAGILLGLLGFLIKINGFNGGILLFIFAFAVIILTISHIPALPKIVVLGLQSHLQPKKSFPSGILNVFTSSPSLHIVMMVSLAHGYYLESGLIMLIFALGTLYIPGKKIFNFNKIYLIIQGLLFLTSALFITNKGLLYTEKFLFSPFENKKIAMIPESLNNIQFLRSGTDQFNNRIVMDYNQELNWMIEGKKDGDMLYIPRFRHKSILNSGSQTLHIKPQKPGFIYFTGRLGKGDYIIRVLSGEINAYELPYSIVLDSGYEFGIHDADVEIPEITITDPGIAVLTEEGQYVEISITENGYNPSVIVLKKGVPATINFKAKTLTDENRRIIMPSYNEYLEFDPGENPIKIADPLIDFIFYSWKGEYGGYILVVDELEGMTKKKVARQIRMFNVNGI